MIGRVTSVGLLLTAALLAGCNNPQPYATDAEVARVSYVNPDPPSLTLMTMVNNRSGEGGHSSLLINASEQVMFDPAGNFHAQGVPERNDVLFGMSPLAVQVYKSGHAREEFHILIQKVEVTPEQAETAYRLALANGNAPAALCAQHTSRLLHQVPGFESIQSTWFPVNLSDQMAQIPGVQTERFYENDKGDHADSLERAKAALDQ